MKRLFYQLKNIRHDKLCLLTFLLPIIAGLAIPFLSGTDLSSISETAFYFVEGGLADETVMWLQKHGSTAAFPDQASLEAAVNHPSTQAIGVLSHGSGIKTLLSGDELQLYTVIGHTLPDLYAKRGDVDVSAVTIIPRESGADLLTSLLIVITMVTAMFMGCTFNSMNMIGEKEDGISLINEILPMTQTEYIVQKTALGFVGGVTSACLTALVCLKITAGSLIPVLLLIVLSAFVAALTGLFIGRYSTGLMAGIACIKVIMILFLAPPVLIYLTVPPSSVLYGLSYLLPSSAAFYGLMGIANGQAEHNLFNIIILSAHCLAWLLLFLVIAPSVERYAGRCRN